MTILTVLKINATFFNLRGCTRCQMYLEGPFCNTLKFSMWNKFVKLYSRHKVYIKLYLKIQGVHHCFVGFHQGILLEKAIDPNLCTSNFTKLQKLLVRSLRTHHKKVWFNLCHIMKRWIIIPCYKLIQSNFLTTTKHRMASKMKWQP